jgi:hypothetical protein
MKLTHPVYTFLTAALLAPAAFAQTGASVTSQTQVQTPAANIQDRNTLDVQRDVNQQQRIEQGLQSGQLTTKEAGQLERQETRIDRMERQADRNGSISAKEQARISAAQNRVSQEIYADKHNAQVGNPNSPSSQRLQADVARNVKQQERIEQGLQSGQLTNREAGHLEAGQARVDRSEARAAANGRVSAKEQARIQAKENVQSRRIYNKKHNARHAG